METNSNGFCLVCGTRLKSNKSFTNLDNAGDLVLNQLEVAITDELNITETDLKANTNLTVEIL